jgi:type II secretory ATPase GspE/PulE/Tfp pilus assembly ATPase PilB-like protein
MTNKYKLVIDEFLVSNWLFVKSICFLFSKKAFDIIFIPKANDVVIKVKSIKASEIIATIHKHKYESMIFSLKLYSSLNVVDKDIIQSSCIFVHINNIKYGFRCSFHPSAHGDCLAIRIINQNYFSKPNIELSQGLTLIAGTTGSGKSTLLYSIMSNFPGHVVSLEDPIEYELPNVCQTNVQQIKYNDALKSVLRQSPDMICIGEIRDKDSADCLINAALTGHIVISTIHASSINDVFSRMKEWNCHQFTSIIKRIIFVNNFDYIIYNI